MRHFTAPCAESGSSSARCAIPGDKDLLADTLVAVRDITGKAIISEDAPLMDMGLSSLGATQLTDKLGRQLGVQLSPILVFEYNTARAIVAHLLERTNDASEAALCHEEASSAGQPNDPM